MINYIALDTETGGLDPSRNPILQIGCYAPDGDSMNVRIIPAVHLEITSEARKVNGWPDSHKGYSTIDESSAIEKLQSFIKSHKPDWIVCHNATFDIPFIREAMIRTNRRFFLPRALCTMSFAKCLDYIGGYTQQKYSLNDLRNEFANDYVRPQTHDAVEDARLTHLVFAGMLARLDSFAKLANNVATTLSEQIEQNLNDGVNTPVTNTTKAFRQGSRWGRSGR